MCRQEWTFKEDEKKGENEMEMEQEIEIGRRVRRREEDLSFLDEEELNDSEGGAEESFIISRGGQEDESYEVDYASFLIPDPL